MSRGRHSPAGHGSGKFVDDSVALRMPRVLDLAGCSVGFGKNSDRVVKVRSRAETAVPPRVVKRVRQHALETGGLEIGGDFVTDQSDLSQ